jgi:ribosomal-protein-alanine N-acetyltransferase
MNLPPLSTRILTDRLCLRPARTTDVTELRRKLRKNDAHLKPWSPAPPPGEDPTSLTVVSRTIIRYRREWKRGEAFVFFVTPRGSDEIIGRIALGGILRGVFQNAYLGYWIDQDHVSKGICTEAVIASTRFAFQEARLHRVQAAVMPNNPRSMRVLEKAGYRREGFAERYLCINGSWEDHVLFARTIEET